ncbi:MAG: S-layer homology domain-containing protein [Candidatus Aquicultor sp.]|nr:S-layer homology domain-containing protein [Candidatus Aquicultor sp.]
MRKTGKNRIIAMILVVSMIIAMVPGMAFAMQVPTAPSKPEIAIGSTSAAAGDITLEETGTSEWGVANRDITFTLPANVTWAASPTVTNTGGTGLVIKDVSITAADVLTVKIAGDNGGIDKFKISNIKYAVGAGAATGDMTLTIATAGHADITTKNAKIVAGIAAAAVTKPDVTVGQNNQAAGNITFTESAAGLLNVDKTISITVPSGVTFYQAPQLTVAPTNSLEMYSNTGVLSNSNRTATWTIKTVSSGGGSVITVGSIAYNVGSSIAEGDIQATVATNDTEPINPTAVKNAKAVVTGQLTVTSTSTNIATGSNQAAGTVTITENAAGVLVADGTITVSTSGGVKFSAAPQAEVTNIALVSNTANLNAGYDQATFTLDGESSTKATIKIKDIILNVPSGTTGAVTVTLGGGAGVTGTKTIANISVSALATVAASSAPSISKNAASQPVGDITITEAAAGSLANANDITIGIFGDPLDVDKKTVLISGVPTVSVESGNINVGTVTLANNLITIDLAGDSTQASKIKISGLKYDVTNAAVNGNVLADVAYSTTRLGAVVNAVIGAKAAVFPDVPTTHWAASYIENLVAKGILAGYTDGTFKPSNTITRAEIAKMVAVAKGLGTATGSSFSDTSGHWAAGYIEAIKAAGYINGYPDGTFRPNNNITRAEIAKIVVLAAGFTIDTSGAGFSDIAGHWASDYILTAANKGVVGGYTDGTFRPSNNATRAEASKMVSVWVNM